MAGIRQITEIRALSFETFSDYINAKTPHSSKHPVHDDLLKDAYAEYIEFLNKEPDNPGVALANATLTYLGSHLSRMLEQVDK